MKKKVFYQNSFSSYFIVFALGFISIGGIYVLVAAKLSFFDYMLCIGATIIFGYETYRIAKYRIILYKDSVFANSDGLSKREGVQYETRIFYKDIEKIDVIKSTKNSLGKNIPRGGLTLIVKKVYLRFFLKNGNYKYILVTFFSKKRISKIIDEIQKRIKYEKTNLD